MNTRKVATEYRMEQWSQAMQERLANGETIKDYCKRIGVSRNTYFYWQRKLREAVVKQMATQNAPPSQNLVPSGWAVCEEPKPAPDGNGLSIEIGKCRVAVGADTKPEHLEKVCRVLMSIC